MFQFRGFPTHTYWFSIRSMILHHGCSHIRKSADRSLFAAPRSLSQLVTSFVGSQCQGILHMLFFAWTTFVYWFFNILSVLSMLELLCFSYLQLKDIHFPWLPSFGKIVSFYPNTEKPDFFVVSLLLWFLVFSLYYVCHVLLFSYSVFNEHPLNIS